MFLQIRMFTYLRNENHRELVNMARKFIAEGDYYAGLLCLDPSFSSPPDVPSLENGGSWEQLDAAILYLRTLSHVAAACQPQPLDQHRRLLGIYMDASRYKFSSNSLIQRHILQSEKWKKLQDRLPDSARDINSIVSEIFSQSKKEKIETYEGRLAGSLASTCPAQAVLGECTIHQCNFFHGIKFMPSLMNRLRLQLRHIAVFQV
jgi:hypothetical protein